MKTLHHAQAIVLATIAVVAPVAHGAEKTWSGADYDVWNNPGSWTPPGVPERGDTIHLNGIVNLQGTVVVGGTMIWEGGCLSGGTLEVAPGATLVIAGDGRKDLFLCTLASEGTILWQGTGTLGRYATGHWHPSSIENRASGLFRIENDALLTGATEQGYNETIHFLNAGTILKTGTTGVTVLDCELVNNGRIDVRTGTLRSTGTFNLAGASVVEVGAAGTLALAAGSFDIQTGATLRAVPGGTLEFGNGSHRFGAGAVLDLPSGTRLAHGAGTYTFEPGFQMPATVVDEFTGPVTLSGELNLPNCRFLPGCIVSGSWTNRGTVAWSGGIFQSGPVTVAAGATLVPDFHLDFVHQEHVMRWQGPSRA
jgi:hypothetical protein